MVKFITFQSTLPARGRDLRDVKAAHDRGINFNPRSPQGGATLQALVLAIIIDISIHAPRKGERRVRRSPLDHTPVHISIHAPRKGERPSPSRQNGEGQKFQSTLPARGSDETSTIRFSSRRNFNPRSPQGGATGDTPA